MLTNTYTTALTTKQIVRKVLCPSCLIEHTFKKKNFMTPFYGWSSTASRLEPLRGSSLLFTTKFPEIPGTQLVMIIK